MKTITINGVGKVAIKPDLIVISMNLKTLDKDYDKAMIQESLKIQSLSKELEEVGFNKNSLKTTNFNVHTSYENVRDEMGRYKNVFIGYECIHNLKIEFDLDIKRLAKVLAIISQSTSKPEVSIAFSLKDPTIINKELLNQITKNAFEKAEILCAASNVKLGELVSINYSWEKMNLLSNTSYQMETQCMMKSVNEPVNIDMEPDDICITDTATFIWEII